LNLDNELRDLVARLRAIDLVGRIGARMLVERTYPVHGGGRRDRGPDELRVDWYVGPRSICAFVGMLVAADCERPSVEVHLSLDGGRALDALRWSNVVRDLQFAHNEVRRMCARWYRSASGMAWRDRLLRRYGDRSEP
jgi:hypothetical protein